MAKQTRQVKGTNVVSHQGKGTSFEQHESFDDSLLPDATELAKLKELDPEIIHWIKARTEKEQDGRLDFNSRKMSILESGTKRSYRVDIYTISCAFVIIVLGMGFSCFLIDRGEKITGTVFAGATILLAANSFLNFRKVKNNQAKK
ncbi:MAG: hypothetical protein H0U95_11260 [Bacteroidetes bacterium]|nr:hypothetical protein [Bacteroidota bacterium]